MHCCAPPSTYQADDFVDEEDEDVKDASDEDFTDEDDEGEEGDALEFDLEDVKGEEFMAVKPWLGAIKEPEGWVEDEAGSMMPHKALELSRVYGYRCRAVYDNVHHDNAGP